MRKHAKVASYPEVFREYKIPPRRQGPQHYRLEVNDSGDLVPVPTETLIGNDTYDLLETGAAVSQDVDVIGGLIQDYELQAGPRTIIRPGVSLGGRVALGQSCEVEEGATLRDASIGDGVIVHSNASVLDSTIEGGPEIGLTTIGENTGVWSSDLGRNVTVGANSRLVNVEVGREVKIGDRVDIGNPNLQYRQRRTVIGERTELQDDVTIKGGRKIHGRTLVVPHDNTKPINRVEQGDHSNWF